MELTELSLVYEEADLFEVCIQEVTAQSNALMCPEWISYLYNEAYRYHVVSLMEQCTEFMATHWDQMLEQPNFQQFREGAITNTQDFRHCTENVTGTQNTSTIQNSTKQASPIDKGQTNISKPAENNKSPPK